MAKDDDIRLMHDYEWLRAIHLEGREVVMQIDSVKSGEVKGAEGRKSKKPVLRFRNGDLPEAFGKLPFALSKTDTNTLATLFGASAAGMAGKWITLYPTTTKLAGDVVTCIRIRPKAAEPPKSAGQRASTPGDAREP